MKAMMIIMKLFKSRAERELDSIIRELQLNLENNYKSVAHEYRIKLGERCEELLAEGKLRESDYSFYKKLYEEYSEKMKNYHH